MKRFSLVLVSFLLLFVALMSFVAAFIYWRRLEASALQRQKNERKPLGKLEVIEAD